LLIQRGFAALERAESLVASPGQYTLQALIAACHARAVTAEETDWSRIAALYSRLAALMPSAVVELNRAVAVSMAYGPAAGLAVVDQLQSDPLMEGYHLLPSVRGDFLARLGRRGDAPCSRLALAPSPTEPSCRKSTPLARRISRAGSRSKVLRKEGFLHDTAICHHPFQSSAQRSRCFAHDRA
jgi:predicted RNA polymerase sigma factor